MVYLRIRGKKADATTKPRSVSCGTEDHLSKPMYCLPVLSENMFMCDIASRMQFFLKVSLTSLNCSDMSGLRTLHQFT